MSVKVRGRGQTEMGNCQHIYVRVGAQSQTFALGIEITRALKLVCVGPENHIHVSVEPASLQQLYGGVVGPGHRPISGD